MMLLVLVVLTAVLFALAARAAWRAGSHPLAVVLLACAARLASDALAVTWRTLP